MKLELVPYRKSFLDPFIRWRSEPASVRHNPLKQMGADEIEAILEGEGTAFSHLKAPLGFRWFVCLEGQVVGHVAVKNVSQMMLHAELGYGVFEAYQRRGIATAAIRMVVDMAFGKSDLRKLIAYVHDRNIPSRRVLEKLGFQQEGLLREHYIINGVPENEVLYGVLRHEWKTSAAS